MRSRPPANEKMRYALHIDGSFAPRGTTGNLAVLIEAGKTFESLVAGRAMEQAPV
jgi:hypothetical protein